MPLRRRPFTSLGPPKMSHNLALFSMEIVSPGQIQSSTLVSIWIRNSLLKHKSQSQLKKLVWLLEYSIHSSTESRNYVFPTSCCCIKPILCYGIETWFDCAATHRRKIQIVQNKQLKIILNRHWRHSTVALHEEAGIPLINDFGKKLTDKFFHKSRFSENPLIVGLNDP